MHAVADRTPTGVLDLISASVGTDPFLLPSILDHIYGSIASKARVMLVRVKIPTNPVSAPVKRIMEIPIFLSCAKGYLSCQETFLGDVEKYLLDCGLRPMTLGRTEYSIDAPLEAIRRLMAGSFGIISIAFRRTFVSEGYDRPNSDIGEIEFNRSGTWLSSLYCQIEPAMAYQIGLPLLIWRENGVVAEGLLDRGAAGLSMPEFDLATPPDLTDPKWKQPLNDWIGRVRSAHRKTGLAPQLW
jgi:hypothetical protein